MIEMIEQAYSRNLFQRFLRRDFLDDYSEYEEKLHLDLQTKFAGDVYRLGSCEELDLEVFEIHHSSSKDARVGIAQDAFKILLHKSYCNRALVAFVPDEGKQWRFSLLQMEASQDKGSRIHHSFSNPRRHSFLLGEGALTKTPEKFLEKMGRIRARKEGTKDLTPWEDLQSRFSVEALTKEFYAQLYNWYLWAVEPSTGVTFPNVVGNKNDDTDNISIKIIRLITRLLFVWFIKQKGLVPLSLFDEEYLDKILAHFDAQDKSDGTYYNAILQNLFFATLNSEVDTRKFIDEKRYHGASSQYGVKTLFRDDMKHTWFKISHEEVLNIFRPVPFMNCGLFECLDKYAKSDIDTDDDTFLDGFSTNGARDKETGHLLRRAFIPNYLFFANEHTENVTVEEINKGKTIKSTMTVSVMGLINLLKLYNFTVQENTPTEVEVSLDPELLGQVFENLLAAYNPETKESARKSTGSFYTPRPIVEYMVNESLVEYLKTKVSADKDDTWRALISYEDKPFDLSTDERRTVLEQLLACKILDPACGSGAFPMGMLQQMVHVIRKVDPDNEMWRELVMQKALADMKEALTLSKEARKRTMDEIEAAFDKSVDSPDYTRKLYIIQNCIYGSDIQPIAMLISKLRFFISLICEQDTSHINLSDTAGNYGIDTLPNLETKFVGADSLSDASIRNFAEDDWTQDSYLVKLKDDLLKIRLSHFTVRTQQSKMRKREEDEAKRTEILNYILNHTSQPNEQNIQMLQAEIAHLKDERKLYEGENIVEEFVQTGATLFDEGEMVKVTRDVNKAKRDEIDSRIKRCETSIKKEYNKQNSQQFENAVAQIMRWNPYDQLKAAPFFDPDWMFGVADGFDIVIGNPPYGASLPEDFLIYAKHAYVTAQTISGKQKGSLDSYSLFIERGYNLLRHNGVFAYIVPISLISSDALTGVHNLLLDNCQTIRISSYAVRPEPVFPNAVVDTCILTFSKTKTPCEKLYSTRLNRKKGHQFSLSNLVNHLEFAEVLNLRIPGRVPKIGTKEEISILSKLLKQHPISEFKDPCGEKIYYRAAGGRYFKVITNYTTNSSAEKSILLRKDLANPIGCILSSSLSFWFYQIFSDNHNWKAGELESFPIPLLSDEARQTLEAMYDSYLKDIENNANVRVSSGNSTYHVDKFIEYKIVKSKHLIDEIDDFIGPLYGLTKDEVDFIKSYELEFRMAGDE